MFDHVQHQQARELMESAWTRRRESFETSASARQAALNRAKQDLTVAAALCREEGSPVDHAQALHLLANVDVDLGNLDSAEVCWEEAIALLRETDDVLQLAHKVRHLGDLHLRCDRLEPAGRCYSEALALYREHASSESLDFANAVRRMADLEERLGRPEQALVLWRETRDLYAAVDLADGVEEANRRIDRLG